MRYNIKLYLAYLWGYLVGNAIFSVNAIVLKIFLEILRFIHQRFAIHGKKMHATMQVANWHNHERSHIQMRFIPLVSSVPLSSLGMLITKQVVIYYHERIFTGEDNSTRKMRLQNLVI